MAEAQAAAKPKKKAGKFTVMMVMLLIGIATPFMLPTVILVLAGLIPTYVAFATDDDPNKSGAISVCAMNIAGLTPFIIDLWKKGQTLAHTFQILGDTSDWLVILGAAAVGQLIVFALPQAIATVTLTHAESRIKTLKKNLDMLKDAWGPDVATAKPIDKITQG